jgi:hypothetical protein
MEIRIKYQKGVPFVMIIEEPGDKFIDFENAMKECIDELAELVQSIKMEKMEED